MEIAIITVSLSINLLLFFYCRFLVKNLNNLVESLKDMSIVFSGFKDHVEMLHETEMFYGDTSLQSLIQHSKFVLESIEENSEVIYLFEEGEVDAKEEKE